MQDLDHIHLLVSGSVKSPPRLPEEFNTWMAELVSKVDMKILMGPFSTYCNDVGNEGLTGITVISTSHFSAHFFENDGSPFFKLDLYSCKTFDPQTVLDHLNCFDLIDVDYTVIDRNSTNCIVTKQGSYNS